VTDQPDDPAESAPSAPEPPPYAPPPQPYGAPPGWQVPPPYGQPPYGQPPQPPPYGAPPGYSRYGYPRPTSTNGFAIAALACSLALSWLFGVGGLLGIIFGIIGIRQCRANNERGYGLAVAGLVIGSIVVLFWLVGGIVTLVDNGNDTNGTGFSTLVMTGAIR
jgi:Domain of unknown function (DUF4190)